jgi:hypothetical protein
VPVNNCRSGVIVRFDDRGVAYTGRMARGWESKSIEAQQEEASRPQKTRTPRSPADAERADRRRALELSRTRAAADLARATAPAHRNMLERALAALDAQLAVLDEPKAG